jgi:hypothetical protein
VREVVVEGDLVVVESDFVEGEWLADLLEGSWKAASPSLPALLRVLADVLEGLSAMHAARGPSREPLHLVHGEVAAGNVLVGIDGSARLAHSLRSVAEPPSPAVVGYLAPEVLLHDHSADERADVFSAGALLWEALAGRRLHAATNAGEIVVRLLGGKVQLAQVPPESSWAQPLAEVARRALSPEVSARYASAAEMTAALKSIAGEHLGSKLDVLRFVRSLAGSRIAARASEAWTSAASAPVAPVAVPPVPAAAPPALAKDDPLACSDRPTLAPPRSVVPPPPQAAAPAAPPPPAPQPPRPLPPRASTLSVPTPAVPLTAVAAYARAFTARTSELPRETPPPLPTSLPAQAPALQTAPVQAAPPPPAPSPPALPVAVSSPAEEIHEVEEVVEEPAVLAESDVPLASTASVDSLPASTPRARRRRGVPLPVAAAALVLVLGLVGFAMTRTPPAVAARSEPAPRAAATQPAMAVASPAPPSPEPPPATEPPVAAAGAAAVAPPVEAAAGSTTAERPEPAAPTASATGELVAPAPRRKPSKTQYYPLGI